MSALGPLENQNHAHGRWQRVDHPQGVFVLVLPRGPGLCLPWALLIHCPTPRPQPGQSPGTVPAIKVQAPPPLGPSRPSHQLHHPPSQRLDGLGLGATLTPPPPADSKLSSRPQDIPLLSPLHLVCAHFTPAELPLSPCCSSNTKLVHTTGPLPMSFFLPGMLPPDFLPDLFQLLEIWAQMSPPRGPTFSGLKPPHLPSFCFISPYA